MHRYITSLGLIDRYAGRTMDGTLTTIRKLGRDAKEHSARRSTDEGGALTGICGRLHFDQPAEGNY
jgi:hypothetical protein